MKLNTRFILLLGLMLTALVSTIVSLTKAHESQTEKSVALLQREQALQLDSILRLVSYPLQHYTRDYSLWDEVIKYLETRDPEWAQINLDASLDTFRLAGTWVYNLEGEEVYSSFRAPLTSASTPYDAKALLKRLKQSPFQHYFVLTGETLLEFQTSPIQPSSDTNRTTPPAGWLVAARAWDGAALQNLAEITRAQVSLDGPGVEKVDEKSDGALDVTRTLNGLNNAPAAQLKLSFEPEQLVHLKRYGAHVVLVVLLQGIIVLAALVIGLRIWILAPFNRISESLTKHDAAAVEPLVHSKSELGYIARLVKEFFSAEIALKRSETALSRALEERVRLGRELHDGVIQNIYAAGMGLSAARDMIKTDPAAAEKKTDDVRSTLNETIREVRSYIVRLELTDFQPKSFRQCVEELMNAGEQAVVRSVDIQVDEVVAERMPITLRTDALRRLRDWIQSASRDTTATKLSLRVFNRDNSTVLMLTDNGKRVHLPSDEAPTDTCRIVHEHLPDGTQRTTISYSSV